MDEWQQISFRTSHEAMDLIANIFYDLGASGVEVDDPAVVNGYIENKLWDYTDIPLKEDTAVVTVTAWLPCDELLKGRISTFEQRAAELVKSVDTRPAETIYSKIKQEDWANNWKQYFHPVKVGEKIVIKPSWEKYEAGAADLVIELDPGCAFGTGTHPTTSMCINLLEKYLKKEMRFFDVGTGSGILAISAAFLGLKDIQAADYDQVAVRTARENVAQNDQEDNIRCFQSDLLAQLEGKADFIAANIIADIILRLFGQLSQKLNPGGLFLASGIIDSRQEEIEAAARKNGFEIVEQRHAGGWAAIVFGRKEDL